MKKGTLKDIVDAVGPRYQSIPDLIEVLHARGISAAHLRKTAYRELDKSCREGTYVSRDKSSSSRYDLEKEYRRPRIAWLGALKRYLRTYMQEFKEELNDL